MRTLGNLLILVALLAGLALSAALFQWDSSLRAAVATPTIPSSGSSSPATGPAPAITSTSSEKPEQGASQSGKVVYNSTCNACHPNGKAGVGPAVIGLSEDTIRTVVRNGKGGMPAFGAGQITDAQLNDLVAYIKSLK